MATARMSAPPAPALNNDGISWITAVFMALFHAAAIATLFFFAWKPFLVAMVLLYCSGSLGIGLGYHRLLTHRGYVTPKWVEYFLTICACTALEGGPIFWVGTHRIHHQFSDREGDPHTPRDGKWWSHMGWILMGESMHSDADRLSRYCPDLQKDKFHVWISKWHWVPLTVEGILLLALGGWKYVMWGIFFRVVVGLHVTWLVNSATHLWGSRRFATRDDSTNCWWVALLSFGEGWHNNHHANPTSAKHGLAWYEFDLNWIGISVLRAFGLAKKIHVARLPEKPKQDEPVPVSAQIELLSA